MPCDHVIGCGIANYSDAEPLRYSASDADDVIGAAKDGFVYCPLCGSRLDWDAMLYRAGAQVKKRDSLYKAMFRARRKEERLGVARVAELLKDESADLDASTRSVLQEYVRQHAR